MDREYKIEVWIRDPFTGCTNWEVAKRINGSRSLAEGLLNQFAADHRARLVNAAGKVLLSRGVVKA